MKTCSICGFGEHSAAALASVDLVWAFLSKDPEGHKDRRVTSWGTKTRCGLAACFERCANENKAGETPAPVNKAAPSGGQMWLDCGEGTLTDPVNGRAISTSVVELEGFGRIFEVYDYSNEPEVNFRRILAAPELLSALQAVMDWWRNEPRPDTEADDVMPTELFDNALRALAKAKGL